MKNGEFGFGVETATVNRVWIFNFKTGNIVSSDDGEAPYAKQLPGNGSRISMIVDKGTISFMIDERHLGTAF